MSSGINELGAITAAYTAPVLTKEEIGGLLASVRQAVTDLREARGWSQKTLAQNSGVEQPVISRIERGTKPDLMTLWKLVDAFGLKASAFFAELERSQNPALKSPAVPTQTRRLNPAPAHVDSLSPAVPLPPEALKEIGRAFAAALAAAMARAEADRRAAGARTRKPARRQRRPRNRRTGT